MVKKGKSGYPRVIREQDKNPGVPPGGKSGSGEPGRGSPFPPARQPGEQPTAGGTAAEPRKDHPNPRGAAPGPPAWAETYRQVIEQAGPPLLLVNGQGEIVHRTAAAGPFLTAGAGKGSSDLLHSVHPALQGALLKAVERASQSGRPEEIISPAIRWGDEIQAVRVRVSLLGGTLPEHLLIAFAVVPSDPPASAAGDSPFRAEVALLRQQLDALKGRYADAVEAHQAHTEELRTTNEELEAGKEELQTLNEELTAVNLTLGGKIDELGQANGDLSNLIAATAIATVFLDRELRITRYTPVATTLFRLTANDVGRPLLHLRHDLEYPALEADAKQVLADLRPLEREVDGRAGQWFLVRLLPYRTVDDRIAGIVLTCIDITERRQAEAHRQAKEAAERINRTRSEFLSRMSHELRTPLNAILGFGQILELGSRDEEDTVALGLILKAGRHLLSLVNEVLDLSQAESGELRVVFGAVDLRRIVRECVQLTARLAETRGVVCELRAPDKTLPPLWTDEQRLRQVLLNLLTNAIKYNRPGGRVTLGCRQKVEGRCLITVRDTGPGISAEDLPRLFTPFERLHHHDGEIEGTGLGLAITHRLVGALGGSIGVKSKPGQGSRFWIELPLDPAPLVHQAEESLPPDARDLAPRRNITLLYIEDNASNLELVRTLAARHWPRSRFLSAHDGGAGLEQARRHRPDLILLDLQLPDRPGDWVLAQLRRDARTALLPVVVLSADATVQSREKLLAGGAAGFVTKPFQIGDLVQVVNRTLHLAPSSP